LAIGAPTSSKSARSTVNADTSAVDVTSTRTFAPAGSVLPDISRFSS
jgi:hypothetical protein